MILSAPESGKNTNYQAGDDMFEDKPDPPSTQSPSIQDDIGKFQAEYSEANNSERISFAESGELKKNQAAKAKTIEFMHASMQMAAMPNPILNKLSSEHISTLISSRDKLRDRQFE